MDQTSQRSPPTGLGHGQLEIIRRLPIGAELQPAGGVHFPVWAPRRKSVAIVLPKQSKGNGAAAEQSTPLTAEPDGYFAGLVESAAAGDHYGFRLDDDPKQYPDPASRFQPDGPHGLS